MNRRALVEFEPHELKFVFELKKQSSCSIRLTNISDEYVAFKVKTTSPKRYCVRPNTGVILPKAACDFTVTMQAQKEAPPDMQLKDKFLIQSTIVPYGATEEDIVPIYFSKENGRYVQENKLRVVLVTPPHSPVSKPVNGTLKLEQAYKDPVPEVVSKLRNNAKQEPASNILASETNSSYLKQTVAYEVPKSEEVSATSYTSLTSETVDEIPTSLKLETEDDIPKSEEISVISYDVLKLETAHEAPIRSEITKEEPDDDSLKSRGSYVSNDKSFSSDSIVSPPVTKDVEAMKLKLDDLELKLNEAEEKIMRLREENSASVKERDSLKHEIALLRKRAVKVHIGFPFAFVAFMALVGLVLGYLLHR